MKRVRFNGLSEQVVFSENDPVMHIKHMPRVIRLLLGNEHVQMYTLVVILLIVLFIMYKSAEK